ncbi:MAG: SAM-dependent methyltransferase [Myxococcota bacterium]|jgi:SAM-dependent methyltransferase
MIRPDPYTGPPPLSVNRRSDLDAAVTELLAGESLLVEDRYSTGLSLLTALRLRLSAEGNDYTSQRAHRKRYQEASWRILAAIRNQRLALQKAPKIGWLELMYADLPELYLSLPQIQGLNSSWQWYQRGLKLPVLDRRLHPLHGTYFPTRHEHLHLLASWLKDYGGARDRAVDVGTGCGVLALMLAASGWAEIVATDINENALEGLAGDLARPPVVENIELKKVYLLGPVGSRFDLILFNPPWMPGETHSLLDKAIYYPDNLFDDFFAAAWRALRPGGRVVLLFSDLLKTSGVSNQHPIVHELKRRKRFEKVRLLERPVGVASKKTRRRKRTGTAEKVQLWELRKRGGDGA